VFGCEGELGTPRILVRERTSNGLAVAATFAVLASLALMGLLAFLAPGLALVLFVTVIIPAGLTLLTSPSANPERER